MSRWWCLPVVACVLVAGCGDDEGTPSETAVVEVVVGPDDRVLSVRLGDGTGATVSTDESSEEVRLDGSSIEDCGDGGNCSGLIVPVHLDLPLGDRRLVDATTGDEVEDVIRCDEDPGPIHLARCEALGSG